MKKYIEFGKRLHEQNKKVGWWDKPRTVATLTNLCISENSEALEGDRKKLPDDKLPHHPMVHVELADTLIRTLDMIAYYGYLDLGEVVDSLMSIRPKYADFNEGLAITTHKISCAFYIHYATDDLEHMCSHLWQAVIHLEQLSEDLGFDLLTIAEEKVKFNLTRPDHQRENRQGQVGQKEY